MRVDHVRLGGAAAGGIPPTGARVYVKAGGAIASGFIVAVVQHLTGEELSGYPAHVVDAVVVAARAILEVFTSNAVISAWSITDPRAHLLLTVVLAVLLHCAWRAAS